MISEPTQPERRHLLLLPLAALFAVHPLAVHGCSCGHDFDFHMVGWMEAARQWSAQSKDPEGTHPTSAFRTFRPQSAASPP